MQVRNRFNPNFDSRHSAGECCVTLAKDHGAISIHIISLDIFYITGYRDLALKVKVGFEVRPCFKIVLDVFCLNEHKSHSFGQPDAALAVEQLLVAAYVSCE